MSSAPHSWEGHEDSLQRQGMQAEHFVQALGASNTERRLCVHRHTAKSGPGYYAYNGMLTSLSAQMCAGGHWQRENPLSMPLLVNRTRSAVLTVSSGDRYTGLYGTGKLPRSKNPKGELTRELTRLNKHLYEADGLFDVENPPLHKLLAELADFTFWVALVYFDKDKLEIRCEVSQPKLISAHGHVKDYYRRIPLPPYSLSVDDFPEGEDPNEGFGPVDFDVTRR